MRAIQWAANAAGKAVQALRALHLRDDGLGIEQERERIGDGLDSVHREPPTKALG
jgi:hypothetical protein